MPNGYVREAFESIVGNEVNTPTLSTKKLFPPIQMVGAKLGAKPLSRDDELRNQDEPIAVITDAYEPTWSQKMRMYPDSVGWAFKHILGAPTTTAGNGVITDPDAGTIPTGTYRHVWTAPFGPSGPSPLTTQMDLAYSDQGVYFKAKGCACEELSITSPEQGGVQLERSGPAAYVDRQSNPSLTPSYEFLAIRPFVRGNLSLPTWLVGSATAEDCDVKIANPVESVRSLGVASKYPDVIEKDNEGPIVFTGSIDLRQLGTVDWDALKAATGFAAVMRWVSDSIAASSYPYKLWIAMSNAQYVSGEADELGNKRRHGEKLEFKATSAGSSSVTVTLVNTTASYV